MPLKSWEKEVRHNKIHKLCSDSASIFRVTLWERAGGENRTKTRIWSSLTPEPQLRSKNEAMRRQWNWTESLAYESWLLHVLVNDSTHLSLSFFSNTVGTITSTPQSCYEDSKDTLSHAMAPKLVSLGLRLVLVDGCGHPIPTPAAFSKTRRKLHVSTLKHLLTDPKPPQVEPLGTAALRDWGFTAQTTKASTIQCVHHSLFHFYLLFLKGNYHTEGRDREEWGSEEPVWRQDLGRPVWLTRLVEPISLEDPCRRTVEQHKDQTNSSIAARQTERSQSCIYPKKEQKAVYLFR